MSKYAYPTVQKGDVLVLPRKINNSRDRFFFLQPFSKGVWLVIIAALFGATFFRFLIEWFQIRYVRSKLKPEVEMKFPLLISAVNTLFYDPQDSNVRYFTSKLVLVGVFLGLYVLHGLYLAAILNVLIREKSDRTEFHYMTYESFMTNRKNKLGCIAPTCDREPYPIEFSENVPAYTEEKDLAAIGKLLDGTLDGIVHDYTYALDFIKRDCNRVGFLPIGKNDWVEEHEAGILRKTNMGWLTSKTFALQHEFDAAMKKLMENGFIESLWEKYITTCDFPEVTLDTSLIELSDIEGIVSIVFGVIGLALLMTLFRFVAKFFSRKRGKTTWKIRKSESVVNI